MEELIKYIQEQIKKTKESNLPYPNFYQGKIQAYEDVLSKIEEQKVEDFKDRQIWKALKFVDHYSTSYIPQSKVADSLIEDYRESVLKLSKKYDVTVVQDSITITFNSDKGVMLFPEEVDKE